MLVSVIVPTHDRVAQVTEAVDSALAQTHREVEVIVVDDGSTDDTCDEVARRYGHEPRVQYVRQAQHGVARSRNRALELARGDMVAFLDSDDTWEPWKLELQLACLRRVPEAGLIWTNMTAVDVTGNSVEGSSIRDILSGYERFSLDQLFVERIRLDELEDTPAALTGSFLYAGDVYSAMALGNLVLPSSAMLTRERLDRVQRFDETLQVAGEDFDFFLRTCREGVVAFIDVPGVRYQMGRDDQLTHPSNGLYLARNYLRTFDAALTSGPERLGFSRSTIRHARGWGYTWIARGYLDRGEMAQARHHLRRGLRLRPTDPTTLVLAVIALLPAALASRVLELARRVVRKLRVIASVVRPRS